MAKPMEADQFNTAVPNLSESEQIKTFKDFLSNYNKLVRPVINVTDAVTVRLKLKLSQLKLLCI